MQIANRGERKAMLVRGLAEVVPISKTLRKINVVGFPDISTLWEIKRFVL
jgi:hypothetical protein